MAETKTDAVTSPYAEFDYNKYHNETVVPAMREILHIIADNGEVFAYPGEKNREEIVDSFDVLAKQVIDCLVKHNVGLGEYQNVFESIQTSIMFLGNAIGKQRQGHERELLSRVIGGRNPGTGKYDVDHATFLDMLKGLMALREQQGGNVEDYFTINPEMTPPPTDGQDNQPQ